MKYKIIKQPEEIYDPTEGMSGTDKFLAGMGKAFTDVGRGVGQLTGFVSDEEVNQAKQRDAALMDTGAGIAGNITGNVAAFAPTALIPGANTYTGAGLIGAGIGALSPVAEGESRLGNVGISAGGGVVGRGLTGAASRFLNPRGTDAGNKMVKEGINMTTGQRLGGMFKRVEEGASSVPIMGDFIKSAQWRGIKDFNRAAINRALAPLGKSTDKIGREAIDEVDTIVSRAYDDALDGVSANTRIDPQFSDDVAKVFSELGDESDDVVNKFIAILKKDVQDFFDPNGIVKSPKRVDTILGEKIRKFSPRPETSQNIMGQKFSELRTAFRELVARQNPQAAPKIKAADEAYANFLRVVRAAGSQGAEDGIFTPSQLSSAIKALDKSKHHKAFSKGSALMQDLSDPGKKAISNKLPDSGTPYRLLNALGLGGAYAIDPSLATAVGVGSAAYTKPGQAAINTMMFGRPQAARQLGGLLEDLYPITPAIGATSAGLLTQ